MDILQPADWSFPVPIYYGPGRLNELSEICISGKIHKPLIVTDRGSKDLPFVHTAAALLEAAGINTALYSDISPNPTDEEVARGKHFFEEHNHDAIIAIGGGSAMDGGKAISLLAHNDEPLLNFEYGLPDTPAISRFTSLICIPTTAGTGAETESTAMITNTALGTKVCLWHPLQKPLAAILDPELSVALPRTLTAWTGVDALVHAIEAYCVDDFHPLCDGAALEAMRLIGGALRTATTEPENMSARGAMLVGSCLGGVSFLKGLGLVHAISHMVGAVYDTQHGLTNAILLPAVLRFNEHEIAEKIPAMANALGLENDDFASFYAAICSLLDDLDIPVSLADIGVDGSRIDELAQKAITDAAAGTNPRQASTAQIADIIKQVIVAGR